MARKERDDRRERTAPGIGNAASPAAGARRPGEQDEELVEDLDVPGAAPRGGNRTAGNTPPRRGR